MTVLNAEGEIRIARQENGDTHVQLEMDGKKVSELQIRPHVLRVGAATVPMDGIGGVETEKECRNRGIRRVMEATIAHMRQGQAAISMLYGIRHFYPKFGFATAGPDHYLSLSMPNSPPHLAHGWRAHPFRVDDLPAVRRIYDLQTAEAVGAAVRHIDDEVWTCLERSAADADKNDCRILVSPDGEVEGYAWQRKTHWYTRQAQQHAPHALVIAEAMAMNATAADALIGACFQWAAGESVLREASVDRILFSMPPEGYLAEAAAFWDTDFMARSRECGDSMVRLLDTGRLLTALIPELERRALSSVHPIPDLHIRTEEGEATLRRESGRFVVQNSTDHLAADLLIELPQQELARLALGALPPNAILDRLSTAPDLDVREIIGVLFPQRHPHLYIPNRF